MNTNKNKVIIKVRDLAVLILVPFSLWSCSLTPVNRDLRNALVLPAAPKWLETTKSVAGTETQPSLFPDGFLDNYIPALKKTIKIPPQKIGPQYDIRKISDVTPQQLDKIFKGKMAGKGAATIKIAKKYGVDPLFIASITMQEAGANFSSEYAVKWNNVAGQLYRDKKTGKWLPIKFKSVEECLERVCQRMRDVYIAEGRTSVKKVGDKYCPVITNRKSKDYNDFKGVNSCWQSGVIKHMVKIQSI